MCTVRGALLFVLRSEYEIRGVVGLIGLRVLPGYYSCSLSLLCSHDEMGTAVS